MKIMRYFPLLALAFLAFILYGLFKTSSYVNKKVDSQTLLSQDSLVNRASDSTALSTNAVIADTLSRPTTALTALPIPIPSVVTEQSSSHEVKKDLASAESITSSTNHATTSHTTKTIATTAKMPLKGTNLTESDSKKVVEMPKIDAKKVGQTRSVVKPVPVKNLPNSTSTTAIKGEIPKSASIEAKTDKGELRFHVIVGTYSQEANAKTRAAAFEQKNNKKATVVKQGGYFRVSADDFEFAQAASQYAQKLKEAGDDNIIVKF